MGCIVNGPGEMADADFGYVGGAPGKIDLYVGKTVVRKGAFFIDNLLVRIHFIIVMVRWTGLAPWELEFPFPGSLASTRLAQITRTPLRSDPECRGVRLLLLLYSRYRS